MIAKAKFAVGDRVCLRDIARKAGLMPRRREQRSGTVIGFGRHPIEVRVRLDGRRCAGTWNADLWRRIPDKSTERSGQHRTDPFTGDQNG